MEGNREIKSESVFTKPLVVYKINNGKAFLYTLKIIEFLLLNNNVHEIYVEDKELNIENIIKYKESINFSSNALTEPSEEFELTKHKLKIFKLGETFPDLCICLGGDGTTLWCSNLFKNFERPPFLTFNLGTLGYMAIYSNNLYKEVLEELYSTNKIISLEKRTMLNCKINNLKVENNIQRWQSDCSIVGEFKFLNQGVESYEEVKALNDIVVEKTKDSNLINLKIFMNDEPLTIVKSDGLIFSTSTGSSAYSLSAGGSVMHHDVDAFILNAICPHSLSFRPIIFPRDITIKLKPCPTSYDKVHVVNDGKSLGKPLNENQYIEVSLSDKFVEFIILENFVPNRVSLWKMKIVDQLGWNNAFQNYA